MVSAESKLKTAPQNQTGKKKTTNKKIKHIPKKWFKTIKEMKKLLIMLNLPKSNQKSNLLVVKVFSEIREK